MKFRTKPFEIEAVQFTGDNYDEVVDFVGNTVHTVEGSFPGFTRDYKYGAPEFPAKVYDYLHNTWVGVAEGQWIIRGQKGEYYPCDPEIFEAKYEPVDELREQLVKGVITLDEYRDKLL